VNYEHQQVSKGVIILIAMAIARIRS